MPNPFIKDRVPAPAPVLPPLPTPAEAVEARRETFLEELVTTKPVWDSLVMARPFTVLRVMTPEAYRARQIGTRELSQYTIRPGVVARYARYGQAFSGAIFDRVELIHWPRNDAEREWLRDHVATRLAPGAPELPPSALSKPRFTFSHRDGGERLRWVPDNEAARDWCRRRGTLNASMPAARLFGGHA